MNRLWVFALLTVFACDKGGSKSSGQPPAVASEAVLAVSDAPTASTNGSAAMAPVAQSASYEGSFKVGVSKSTTTKKEGAPDNWEKDDGAKFTGDCQVKLSVSADGIVDGTLKGALGQFSLRGKSHDNDVRAVIVPQGGDVTAIQNGFIILTRDGEAYKGKLTAATGDALLLRTAEVELKKSAS